jgi:LmbE family N-acetylglucosaminyl deacetylase/glycosyltransferase involved in cell wall biosynthesis
MLSSVLIEAEAIPYEPSRLRGERLLVLAPHPDDEVIGCGGLVAQHLREQRAVRVVIATDGAQAGDAAVREEESRRALSLLGGNPAVDFLHHPDRELSDVPELRDILFDFRPDLILAPSPIEIHPDHLALSRALCELVQRDETLFADLAVTKVAFYEVGQPLRPNAIVDITGVADAKYEALAAHQSQLEQRDYLAYTRGLNAYRAMTLAPETRYAEAYYVVDLPLLRTAPFSELRTKAGAPMELEVARETVPISVVVRTKNRENLLREAIDSIRANGYPCEIVVVNDGGERVALENVTLVEHDQSRGRSEAGNAGVRAASNAFIAFLDDDDLFYPEHLATLANASKSSHAAWYTDAVSAFLRPAESGEYETHSRLRLFAQDFDRDLLLVDNFIPLPTLLVRRDHFLGLGGFDASFDLFEDWDFLIRLSARGDFLRVPRITCEIRHFEGGSSVVLAAPEGTPRFREAKLRIWQKHAEHIDNNVIANAFERQKRRALTLYSEAVEAKGAANGSQRDAQRLQRELETLHRDMNDSINGYALRVRELEGAVNSLAAMANDYEYKTVLTERLQRENENLKRDIERLNAANYDIHEALQRTRVEVDRLNGLLEMIYRSRTWKLHTTLERLRGRG